jgi:competence ComEA-like helix-hairpin-helix protein
MQPSKKHFLKSYFTFSANEKRAIFLLLTLSSVLFILPHLFPSLVKSRHDTKASQTNKREEHTNARQSSADYRNDSMQFVNKTEEPNGQLFYFDPNTITLEEWIRLGVREKTAKTIVRYRMRGGQFNDPQDIKKIWGLSPEKANKLIPYVRIHNIVRNKNEQVGENHVLIQRKQKVILLDINKASQQDWESLKGVGPSLSARIIKFRNKLGGFISVQQVGETYGLPDSTFKKILPFLEKSEYDIIKLNINLRSIEELTKHPYIDYRTAKALVTYREQHGLFNTVHDVRKIESVSDTVFNKIEKYLSIQ